MKLFVLNTSTNYVREDEKKMVQSWQIFLCIYLCILCIARFLYNFQSLGTEGIRVSSVASEAHCQWKGGGARLIKNLGKQNRKRALNMVMCNFAKKGLPHPPPPSSPLPLFRRLCSYYGSYTTTTCKHKTVSMTI